MNNQIDNLSISFNEIVNNNLAVCELSLIADPRYVLKGLDIDKEYVDHSWYYFSRLLVPTKLRRQGIGKKILKKMIDYMDTNKFNILLEINPYKRDEKDPDLKDLIEIYSKFGFKKACEPNTMIRYFENK
jgi:GNAT superfamily N-acetyltransferase